MASIDTNIYNALTRDRQIEYWLTHLKEAPFELQEAVRNCIRSHYNAIHVNHINVDEAIGEVKEDIINLINDNIKVINNSSICDKINIFLYSNKDTISSQKPNNTDNASDSTENVSSADNIEKNFDVTKLKEVFSSNLKDIIGDLEFNQDDILNGVGTISEEIKNTKKKKEEKKEETTDKDKEQKKKENEEKVKNKIAELQKKAEEKVKEAIDNKITSITQDINTKQEAILNNVNGKIQDAIKQSNDKIISSVNIMTDKINNSISNEIQSINTKINKSLNTNIDIKSVLSGTSEDVNKNLKEIKDNLKEKLGTDSITDDVIDNLKGKFDNIDYSKFTNNLISNNKIKEKVSEFLKSEQFKSNVSNVVKYTQKIGKSIEQSMRPYFSKIIGTIKDRLNIENIKNYAKRNYQAIKDLQEKFKKAKEIVKEVQEKAKKIVEEYQTKLLNMLREQEKVLLAKLGNALTAAAGSLISGLAGNLASSISDSVGSISIGF